MKLKGKAIDYNDITPYHVKTTKLSGTSYAEVKTQADILFKQIKSKTKGKPYIRSAYFNKQKIFFDYFWIHLRQKSLKERIRRLKYFSCAVELIKSSRNNPVSKENVDNRKEILHRFAGRTKNNELFFVQIKEDKKSGKKDIMSCFPLK